MLLGLIIAANVAVAAPPPSSSIQNPDWETAPGADDVSEYYPKAARARGVSGRAEIDCEVMVTGALSDCAVTSETPAGMGFGTAAISLAPRFKMKPRRVDGLPVEGAHVHIPVRFQLDDAPAAAAPSAEAASETPEEALNRLMPGWQAWAPWAALGVVVSIYLAAALNDWVVNRGGRPRVRLGSAAVSAFKFIGRGWSGAPGPLLILGAVTAGLSWLQTSRGFPPAAANLLSQLAALLAYGALFRLGLRDLRPNRADLKPGPFGLKIGLPEFLLFGSWILVGVILVLIVLGGAVLGVGVGIALSASAPWLRDSVVALYLLLLCAIVFWVATRFFLIGPHVVFARKLEFGEPFGMMRGALFAALVGYTLFLLIGFMIGAVAGVASIWAPAEARSYLEPVAQALLMMTCIPFLAGFQVAAYKMLNPAKRRPTAVQP